MDFWDPDMGTADDLISQIIRVESINTDCIADVQPRVEILIQPSKKGYRFRYSSEGHTHGGIPGVGSAKGNKKYPTIHIANYTGKAAICINLVTEDDPPKIHAHNLVGKNVTNGMYYSEEDRKEFVLDFQNLGIQHVTKKDLVKVLHEKLMQSHKLDIFREKSQITQSFDISTLVDSFGPTETNVDAIDEVFAKIIEAEERKSKQAEAEKLAKEINLSAVRLCIQVFIADVDGRLTVPLEPVFSQPIYDAKAAHAGQLRICRVSESSSSVLGGKEVFLLCDKVQKEDIAVRFYLEDDRGNVKWEKDGTFTSTDVHKQCAIVFKTPSYVDRAIQQPVTVKMKLVRKNNNDDFSEPIDFMYKPEEFDKYKIGEKRRKPLPAGIHDMISKRTNVLPSAASSSSSSTVDPNLATGFEHFTTTQNNTLSSGMIRFFQ